MTKDEMIAHVRMIGRKCRGPLAPDARKIVSLLLAEGKTQEAQKAAVALDKAKRKPCGYDFNETILAAPFDGEIHKYKCPKCGLVGVYRAPQFEAEE